MAINCCQFCVAPKRYPGCHDRCSEYAVEKANHNAQKLEYEKRKRIEYGLNCQYASGVYKARKAAHKKG